MGGRPQETSDREILEVFRESEDPVLSTGEVAAGISYSQPGTYKRLKKIENQGDLASKMLGDVRAWWLTQSGDEYINEAKE